MKKVIIRFSAHALMLLMSLFTVYRSAAQQPYECKIQNINLTAPNIMEFDVYIKNTGSATLLLNAYQGGVDFNYVGMAGSGTITGAFVAGSNTLPAPQNAPNWNINATSKQIRMVAALVTSSGNAAAVTSTPLKIGTFRMTNTVPFTACATPNFSWSFITAANKTKTAVTCWVNGGTSPTAITSATHAAATFANGGGPQHYVESNPAITCCPTVTIGATTPALCFGGNGSANISVSGGTGGTYTVNGGSVNSFSGSSFSLTLAQGTHSVEVTPTGCTPTTLSVVIGGPAGPIVNLSTISACDSYTWAVNGMTYTTSGAYSNQSTNANGCTVMDYLDLTIIPSTSVNISACDSYTWSCNSQTYTTSGTYTCGCNTLNLTINTSTANTTTATACDNYIWSVNGTNYIQSGTYTSTSTNAAGCPHTETLNLTINNSSTGSTTATACNSYTWAVSGATYTSSGTYNHGSMNAAGCTHVDLLFLTINPSTSNTSAATACDSYTWSENGMTYTVSGSYSSTSTNTNGCAHTEILNLTINPSTSGTTSASACDSYTWSVNVMTYTSSGTYSATSTNAAGCAHTETLNLTINNSTSSTLNATACGSYTWACNGQTYSQSGLYTCTSTNAAGCLNMETLNLTITTAISPVENITACNSFTWGCNGQTYTQSGSYTCATTGSNGCPSTVTLNLIINNSNNGSSTTTACNSAVVDGLTYTTSGSHNATYLNAAGCDSVHTYNVTIYYSNMGSSSVTACDMAVVGGMTYTTSGSHTATFLNAAGCDSVHTYNVTINYSNMGSSSVTACDMAVVGGMTYTTSGSHMVTYVNAAGCDSVHTYNVTINSSTTGTPTSAVACDSYTWTQNGMTYTTSGTYTSTSTNAAGCTHTETFNLTINNSTSGTTTVTACDSYTWGGALGNGMTYTWSQSATSVTTNAAGCTHTETLNLTINNSSSTTINESACNTFTWACNGQTYTQSGQYTCTGTNASGCPVTITLNLTINGNTTSVQNTTSCSSYMWSCNGQTYTQSGQYTCAGTNANGCSHVTTLNLTINNCNVPQTLPYECIIKNITQVSSNVMEFDVFLKNNSTSALKLNAFQGGIDFNYAAMAGSGTITGAFVAGSNSLPGGQANPNWNINAITKQIRLLASVVTSSSAAASITSTPLKLGTFRMTNTVAFGPCATPNFTWSFVTAVNKTKTTITAWIGTGTSPVSITDPTHPAASFANGGGPQHYVESNPMTPSYNTTAITACDSYTWAVNGQTYTQSGTYSGTSIAGNGCLVYETLNLTINNSTTSSVSHTECDSYTWSCNGMTYTQYGTYTCLTTNAAGCDHIATLQLTILNSTTSTETATACDSYTWSCNGMTYTQSGTYNCLSTNSNGCTHNTYLNLTINNSSSSTTTASACDTYTWGCNGQTYTQSGTYTCQTTNAAGCSHIEYLNLTIHTNTTSSTAVTACDNYVWSCNNLSYTQTGTYTCVGTNAAGCPQLNTLILTVNYSTTGTQTISACNSYLWSCNGQTYTQSGTYSCAGTNSMGCAHNTTLALTVNSNTSSSISQSACNSFTWAANGMTYTASGSYTSTSTNSAGCLHTTTLNLTILNSTTTTTNITSCDSYTWGCNNQTYTQTGTYTCFTLNAVGCIQTNILNLTINNSTVSTTGATACSSYTWSCNGQTYNQTGTYTCITTNGAGCPQVNVLNLTILSGTTSSQNATACNSYTWPCNGQTYTQSGVYTCVGTNSFGCQHITTLNLTIQSSTSSTVIASACDAYTWSCNGQTYTQSGTYTCVSTNTAGCPHTTTLILTISNSTSSTTSATACNSYQWGCNGQTYNQTGVYTCNTTNAAGCTQVNILNLTINNSTTSGLNTTACDTYTWSCNGQTYNQSGSYTCTGTNTAGCSHVTTLNLTINQSTSSVINATSCNSYTWSCNGQTYTQSGTYTCVTNNSAGCSHTTTLVLTIINSTTSTVNATACNNYTWSCNNQTYSQSGTYICNSINTAGCSQVNILNLTINNTTTSSTTIATCGSYLWPCNGQTYTQSGSYTCTSTNTAGCTHTTTLNLTINPYPTVIAANVTTCAGTPVTLSGSPAGGSFSVGGVSVTNPYSGGASSYVYTFTTPQGCASSATGTITYTPAPSVSNIIATNVTSSTATVSWTGNGGSYQLRYKKSTSTTWISAATNGTTSRNLTALSPSSTYNVEVRSSCTATSTPTAWVAYNFNTPGCATPALSTTTNITMTGAKLNWTHPGAPSYNIRYRKSTVTAWTTTTSTTLTKILTGLVGNSLYYFQIQANCPPVGSWSTQGAFTTLASKDGEMEIVETTAAPFVIYPNPTKGMIRADVTMDQNTPLHIDVIDMTGRIVKRYDVEALEGINQFDMDLSNTSNGIYSIRFFSNGEMLHQTRVTKSE